jgi:hypothetical protein
MYKLGWIIGEIFKFGVKVVAALLIAQIAYDLGLITFL